MTAATAAAQAAAALGQLAAALAGQAPMEPSVAVAAPVAPAPEGEPASELPLLRLTSLPCLSLETPLLWPLQRSCLRR